MFNDAAVTNMLVNKPINREHSHIYFLFFVLFLVNFKKKQKNSLNNNKKQYIIIKNDNKSEKQ